MSKLFLETEDFNGRLNKSIFTNIEKGMSQKEFDNMYPSANFDVFEKSVVEGYILDTYKATGGEIVKGSFNDTPEIAKALAHMKEQISGLSPVNISDNGVKKEVFVMLKAKSEEGDDKLQKGKIANNLMYSDAGAIEFEKTGEEIKTQVSALKLIEKNKCKELADKLSEMQTKFKENPTEDCYKYGLAADIECPYKCFNWNLTYFDAGENMNSSFENSDGSYSNRVASEEDAQFHREWNNTVEKWIDCHAEIKAIEVYENNLKDDKTYKLTANQMLFFGF